MEVIDDAQADIARLAVTAAKTGKLNGRELRTGEQLRSIWDVLDRGGTKKADKSIIGVMNIAEMVAEAYRTKHQKSGDDVNCQSTADPVAESDSSTSSDSGGGSREQPPLLLLPPPPHLEGDACQT